MNNIQVFISINNKTICATIDLNSLSSSIYNIIQSKLDYDVSKSHNLYFSGQTIDPQKKLNEYKIIPESQIRALYSMSKDLASRPPDLDGINAYKKLIKQFEKNYSSNSFNIFSIMSYNVCDINDSSFKNDGTFQKNLYQQLQPDAIVDILNDETNKNLKTIKLNIILSDSGFISFNENLINIYNNSEYKSNKHSIQIDGIFGLIPYPSYLKTYLNQKTNKLQNKYANRIIKFYCPDSSKEAILKYFKLDNDTINKKIKLIFYYVGINYPDANIEGLINYSNILKNSYINMWTGEFLLKKQSNNKYKANNHNIRYLSYNNPTIRIV